LIAARVQAVEGVKSVALHEADNRVLAEALHAPVPLPLFMNSAVDGYAIASSDLPLDGPHTFPVSQRITAGAQAAPLAKGTVARIFTGAPMPENADTVFMQEDVEIDGDKVILPPGLKPRANMRPAGEDIEKGAVAIAAGTRLRPQHVALAAALGLTTLSVRRRIKVAVFSTGNEVVAPGEARSPAQLYDSNRFMLASLLRRLGCDVADLGILRDDRAALTAGLKQAAKDHDLILTSGGVSTGEEDHVRASVESAGSLVLWRMGIKPGRPVAMGVIEGTPFIGLPGNPVASFVTFAYVVRPTVLALAGARPEPLVALPVRAHFTYKKKKGRREYVRASLITLPDGTRVAEKFPREGAGLLSSLCETDGLVELPEDCERVAPGDAVGFLNYPTLI
jgi:molybdopterin molybdotransferase